MEYFTFYSSRFTFYVLRFTFYSSLLTPHSSPLPWLLFAAVTGLSYLAVAWWGFGVSGFPLDDAWIHQTYARNLAESGQFAFVPGRPSAGSTAPLWSALVAVGYLVGLPYQLWTYGLGLILLGLTGWTISRLAARLFPEQRYLGLWTGCFGLLEWHHVWAALSGMETMLFVWLSVLLVERYLAYQAGQPDREALISSSPYLVTPAALRLGLLGGLLALTRPEGLGLLALIALDMTYRHIRSPHPPTSHPPQLRALIANLFSLAAGLAVLLGPYIAFHLWMTGLPFPNTLYAKQAEYRIILEGYPLWWRLFGNWGPTPETVQGVFRVIFIGPQVLLLPGLVWALWLTWRDRRADLVLLWLWWAGYLLLYAGQLPVTYQHGRYQIPAIIWTILLGLWGAWRGIDSTQRPAAARRILRVVSRTMKLAIGLLLLGFTVLGAQAFGRDVRFIESEMVATARWLAANTGPQTLIAAHDIGAIGYFTRRPLLDLAGLITPEVIPIIRDEPALFDFILTRQAGYFVTFPSWYPWLSQNPAFRERYRTNALWTRQAGGDNMVVYELVKPDS